MKNSIGSNVETLYKLMEDRVEALEFIVNQNCRMIGIRLQDMKTRPNLLVAAINRQERSSFRVDRLPLRQEIPSLS